MVVAGVRVADGQNGPFPKPNNRDITGSSRPFFHMSQDIEKSNLFDLTGQSL